MNVTRDVVTDLFPLYLNGDLSDDSKTLVEEFLATDSELAAKLHEQAEADRIIGLHEHPPTDLEMKALHRARRHIDRQRWLFAGAWVCTGLTFATRIHFESGNASARLVLMDFPLLFAAALTVTSVIWLAYFRLNR